jgi:hypothetical protein
MGESCGGKRPIGRSRGRWQDTVLDKCKSTSDMVLEGGNKEQKIMEVGYRGGHAPQKTCLSEMEEK